MQKRLFCVVGLVLFAFFSRQATAQISVSASFSAQALAAKLAGPGVTILNPVLNCPLQANGIFRVVSGNLGLDSGIVLTTGLAASSPGIGVNGPAYNLASTKNNTPGDPQLDPLAGQTTHDACSLEFDVIPQGDTVKFDYVFGSEEYINSTCGPYNDAFAFFISGPGISGAQNMALVPGTNIPVTINSINSGVPGPGLTLANCTSMGPGSPFTSYFINNNTGTTLSYEGFTVVLKAWHAVTPCATYHLKMAIADGGNYLYDSGVFIRAGSLEANTLKIFPVGGNDTVAANAFAVKGCAPGRMRIRRPQPKPVAETVKYFISGTAVNGVDYVQIPDSIVIAANQQDADVMIRGLPTAVNGPKTVRLLVKSPLNCSGSAIADSATLVLLDTITAHVITPATVLCNGESIRLQATGDTQLSYHWSPATGLDSAGSRNPLAMPSVTTFYKLNATWPAEGCPAKGDSVKITVLPVPVITTHPINDICPHTNVQLNATVTPAYSGYTFTWSGPNGYSATGQTPTLSDARRRDNGYYYIIVKLDTSRCTARDSLLLTVTGPDSPGVSPIVFCQGKPAAQLTANGADLRWYTSPNGGTGSTVPPIPNTDNIGVQYYYVSQTVFDCESERNRLTVEIKPCCDKPVYIPTAFTPNKDGHNDTFSPRYPGFGNSTYSMKIYNRWGQMVFQSYDNTSAWNGLWNGKEADAGTYYYELVVTCKEGGEQHFKGDVLLVR